MPKGWYKVRAEYLRAHPHCERCGDVATDIDHITPRSQGGTDDWSNLQALCHSCHSHKTARYDGGFGHARR
jgi:5-methylcytosine-specific restriction enzyme A